MYSLLLSMLSWLPTLMFAISHSFLSFRHKSNKRISKSLFKIYLQIRCNIHKHRSELDKTFSTKVVADTLPLKEVLFGLSQKISKIRVYT